MRKTDTPLWRRHVRDDVTVLLLELLKFCRKEEPQSGAPLVRQHSKWHHRIAPFLHLDHFIFHNNITHLLIEHWLRRMGKLQRMLPHPDGLVNVLPSTVFAQCSEDFSHHCLTQIAEDKAPECMFRDLEEEADPGPMLWRTAAKTRVPLGNLGCRQSFMHTTLNVLCTRHRFLCYQTHRFRRDLDTTLFRTPREIKHVLVDAGLAPSHDARNHFVT